MEGGVRRSTYGGDSCLVFSQIHRKNLRRRGGGKRQPLLDFFSAILFPLRAVSPLFFVLMTGGNGGNEAEERN